MAEGPDRRIGGTIARLREERGWSQRSLAKVVGLDQSALSRVEAGKRRLAAGELDVIARALGVSPAALLAGSGGGIAGGLGTSASTAGEAPSPSTPHPAASPVARDANDPGPGVDVAPLRRSGVDPEALSAAVDEAGAIFERLQAERAADEEYGGRVAQRVARGPASLEPEILASRLAEPSASHRIHPRAPSPEDASSVPRVPGDTTLPAAAEGVIADWFALRAAAASPRDWEHAAGRGLRASGKPVHGAPHHPLEPGVTTGAPHLQAAVSPIVGQPWSLGTPRDRVARFWRQELHIDPDGPVPDLVPLLEDVAGIEVIVVRLGGETPVCGSATRDGAAFILVNAARPVVLQRYALAHALGHLALGHGGVVDERIDWGQGNAREAETNDFAEELLVPAAAVARWYDRHGDPAPDVETVVELANAFGVSFWAAMYRSRAAGRLSPKRQAALAAELRRMEWQLLPRQAFLGGLKDTLSALTPEEVRSPGTFGPPAVLRVPARMRTWALRAVSGGVVSLESAASALRMPPGEFARELAKAGVE